MQFGNLSGLVSGTESIVFDYTVEGNAVSSISTGNILNGDEDGWYTVIVRCIHAIDNHVLYARLNNDSGANYGIRDIRAESTTVSDASGTGQTAIYVTTSNTNDTNYSSLTVMRIYAKSGAVRLINMTQAGGISGTTVNTLETGGQVWNNTADNITNINFVSSGTGIGVGTRIIILKSNNFTNGTPTGSITTPYIKGAWVRVGSQVLASAANSVTFSGLDGDRDVLYYLSGSTYNAAGAAYIYARLNNDTGAASCGLQQLYGTSTTVGGNRYTDAGMTLSYVSGANFLSHFNALIFAKTGFIRPAIVNAVTEISGTTVGVLRCFGQSWNNTANNITSIVVMSPTSAAFAAGSQFELYALRPNG